MQVSYWAAIFPKQVNLDYKMYFFGKWKQEKFLSSKPNTVTWHSGNGILSAKYYKSDSTIFPP